MNDTVLTPTKFALDTMSITERCFLEYFYTEVYNPLNVSLGKWCPTSPPHFSRSLIKSICIKFGYEGTLSWIVRKAKGRTIRRAVFEIPEIVELHEIWQTSCVNINIITKNNITIVINRKNNVPQ